MLRGERGLRHACQESCARTSRGPHLSAGTYRPEDDAMASPITYVNNNATPFFISWGDRDYDSVMRQSHAMVEALRQQPCRLAFEEMSGFDHFRTNEDTQRLDSPWVRRVHEWMRGNIAA